MNKEEFLSCTPFKLILGTYAAPKSPEALAQHNSYLELIYRAVGHWKEHQFERVCDQVIKTMARGQRPMPEDFLNAQKALNEAFRANPVMLENKCQSCKGTGWIWSHMVKAATGEEGDFAVPCPLCRQFHPFKDAMPRQGWTFQDTAASGHTEQLLEMAAKMGAKGARFVLDLADRHKVNFPDSVLSELVRKAGDEVKQSNPQVEAIIEKLDVIPDEDAPIDWAEEAKREAV